MATAVQKITLSSSRDIPFNKLVLSQSNVRRVKAGVSIEELAEDIARRGLLQGLNVRALVDADGVEIGMYEIPAGGRRYRALELLVKRKRLARTAPVPCIVREGGIAEEDSLAENVQRAPLHPLDQFRAFLALREKGQSEEEIAAAFFVSVAVVKQRLKLASLSLKLLDTYAEDDLTLDQLMAFTVTGDHERQEQVLDRLSQTYDKQPYAIRRMLTEGAVRASDKRARFVGIEVYEAAGGTVLRDLFQGDDGGWLQDATLVDRMVVEKLAADADAIRGEGWKWIEVAPDFAYGHTYGLRQLRGEPTPLTKEEEAARVAAQAECDQLSEKHADADELPEEVDARLGELEAMLEAFETRPLAFDPAEVARAGAFVSIAQDGKLRVERGFVRPEDEVPVEEEHATSTETDDADHVASTSLQQAGTPDAPAEPEEEDGLTPISDRLLTELTTHRTLGLRHALGEQPDVAFLAAVHALTLKAFYAYGSDSCLELDLKSVSFNAQAPGLNDSVSAEAMRIRHESWAKALPKEPGALWDTLSGWDRDSQSALFAHVVSLSVNAVHEAWNRRPRAFAHADKLAQAVSLDMAAAGWKPTVDTFLGRVTKARILQGVTEAKGERAAEGIAHLKKGDMAREAESLLVDSGWLPEALRTQPSETAGEETAEIDGETAMGDSEDFADSEEPEAISSSIAAE
ncbi:ParB/RepB/Spo0J family partition protein [Xanthobacter aminoxidans]|uniref:ParB/RepB/Spo0J family partition protein n=1 Tax=Xanthobacter aminoxidans TaxID=186280 RepID=UPI002022FC8A|nr:ParB/RepB/Spo0J family partition protein [Xanthobacter aminoxidans]MCL8385058.1 ParB/RepB/Spo0J family partition protein [Xanthobacter aminoxidans]